MGTGSLAYISFFVKLMEGISWLVIVYRAYICGFYDMTKRIPVHRVGHKATRAKFPQPCGSITILAPVPVPGSVAGHAVILSYCSSGTSAGGPARMSHFWTPELSSEERAGYAQM
ncbi:hypothetical protein BELL_0309g00060 [Botrytis elliptica]|uniref:Uncharacterized protein n=1 Tax=Botrytis elliptica TaxID=278938 RepID=A0A4Z1JKA3_9HELO|nr:hypothetical protein BELL_0309g00060 [Botrytis elliptica]